MINDLAHALSLAGPDWTPEALQPLHPEFRLLLLNAVLDAKRHAGLRVVPISGYRSPEAQGVLRRAYEAAEAEFKAGKTTLRPLPAAQPGHSAHNYEIVNDEGQTVPASLAEDVAILDHKGDHIPSGGGGPFTARPREWQLWAQVLALHKDTLRDGGEAYGDPVHVEDVRWDDKTFTFGGAAPAVAAKRRPSKAAPVPESPPVEA